MDATDLKKIEDLFKHHVGVMTEEFQHRLDLVAEGHQLLHHKIDEMGDKIDLIEKKLDSVVINLAAHRSDTEAHGPVYRVKESGE